MYIVTATNVNIDCNALLTFINYFLTGSYEYQVIN